MNPLYFGSRRRLLFGVYHPPTGRPVEPVGIVLCPPLALEYMRVYRALRQLALHLTERGFHVLRFDYHGTGDSGGDGTGESLDGWRRDVETAMQELGDLSGVSRFTLVGVRFGAVLAARAAAGSRTVDDLVFWDPAVQGRRYLDWLLVRGGRSARERQRAADPQEAWPEDESEVLGVDGFPMELGLLREVGAADLGDPRLAELPIRRIAVVAAPHVDASPLLKNLEDAGLEHAHRAVPDEATWEDPHRQGSIVLAPRALREITDLLAFDRSES